MITSPRSLGRRGFSLVELLVVIAIIAIIAGFAVPAVGPMVRGSSLTQAGTLLTDQMSLARQHALSRNRMVEVRFYRYGDPEVPGEKADDPTTGQFRAVQLFERADAGLWVPINKPTVLPTGMIINPAITLSTLIADAAPQRVVTMEQVRTDAANHVELPRGVGMRYEYRLFHFVPSGGTDLPLGDTRWHVTVHPEAMLPQTQNSTKAPPDYVCWSLDPVSGVGKVYRPGL